MASKVDDILEVLLEVWVRRHAISAIRRTAEKEVAKRRGTTLETVHSKLTRGLKPFVENARDFDDLVSRWLYADDRELERVLLAKARNAAEREGIRQFFSKPGWPQAAA